MIAVDELNSEGRQRFRCETCGLITAPILPGSAAKLRCRCHKPGLTKQAVNFARDSVAHVADGFVLVSNQERSARLATCQSCPLFNGTICTHVDCGCPMSDEKRFFDALSWRSKKCPLGKWPG